MDAPPTVPINPPVIASTATPVHSEIVCPSLKRQRLNYISLFLRIDQICGRNFMNTMNGEMCLMTVLTPLQAHDPVLPASSVVTDFFSGIGLRNSEWRARSAEYDHARNTQRAFGTVPGSNTGISWVWGRGRTPEINAAFRTRHGAIKIDAAIVGDASRAQDTISRARGRVMASSRHGNVSINLVGVYNIILTKKMRMNA